MNRTALIGCLVLGACHKEPPTAPKELGELGAFLFANFNVDADEDPELYADYGAGLVNLRTYLTDDVKVTGDSGTWKDLAVTMPILEGEDLGDLKIPDGADPAKQVNRAIPGMSSHPVNASRELHVQTNQICIESSSTLWAGRSFLSDEKCWEDESCDSLQTETEVYKKNILAEVWYDQFKDYRYFEVEDENGDTFDVIVGRAWIEEVFPAQGGGNNSWDQLFQLDVSIQDPKKDSQALRWFSMWSSITLGGLSDDAYGALVVDGVIEGYVYGDEFIDGVTDGECKNDRQNPKPDRG